MKVVLKENMVQSPYPTGLPNSGDVGEALYFRYDENNILKLIVLFYGYPGTHEVYPSSVESMVSP